MTFKRRRTYSLVLAALMTIASLFVYLPAARAATTEQTVPATAATENFYLYVNRDWINKTPIPSRSSSVGSFASLDDDVNSKLRALFLNGLENGLDKGTDSTANMLQIYRMFQDTKQRNADGLTPIRSHIENIEAIKSIADLERQLIVLPTSSLFTFTVMTDFVDSSRNILAFSSGVTTLPDKSFYDTKTETGQYYVDALRAFYEKLLTLSGKSAAKAKTIAADAIEIETLIANNTLTMEEAADVANLYTPTSLAELDAQVKCFDIQGIMKTYAGPLDPEVTAHINCLTPQYYASLDKIVTTKNLPKLKNYMLAQLLSQKSDVLTTNMLLAYERFTALMTGTSSVLTVKDRAFHFANNLFPYAAGKLYTDAHFSESAKKDVTAIAKDIIAVYQKRLANLDWMSAETKKHAQKKLDNLTLKIGYPAKGEYFDPYEGYVVPTGAKQRSLSETLDAMSDHSLPRYIALLSKPVDRSYWEMSPQTVNAYYDPMKNEIVFPAAILQAPLYSPTQSASKNYGAIGTVIGHEISHAFDQNGSMFDEKGNMKNWWTDADTKAYEQKAKAIVAQYNGVSIGGRKINGSMTLNENIADLGGMASALQAAQAQKGFSAKAFFQSYATLWREKLTDELAELYARVDVHAPNEARVNVVLRNTDLFHTTYQTKPGDGMYLAKSKRIAIW